MKKQQQNPVLRCFSNKTVLWHFNMEWKRHYSSVDIPKFLYSVVRLFKLLSLLQLESIKYRLEYCQSLRFCSFHFASFPFSDRKILIKPYFITDLIKLSWDTDAQTLVSSFMQCIFFFRRSFELYKCKVIDKMTCV